MTITPARDIQYYRDEQGYVRYQAKQGSKTSLVAGWLQADVQSADSLVVVLDAIEQRRSGSTERPYEASGNAWVAVITRDQIDIENMYNDSLRGTVTTQHALGVLRAYADALGDKAMAEGAAAFVKHEGRDPQLPW